MPEVYAVQECELLEINYSDFPLPEITTIN